MESAAAPVLRRLMSLSPGSHPISIEERDYVGMHVAALHARVPTARDSTLAMSQLLEGATFDMHIRNPALFRKRARERGMQGDDEELERERLMVLAAVEAGEVQMEAPVEWGLIGLGVALESIRPLVASMHFMVVHRNRFPALVIGDQPVVLSPPPGHSPLSGYAFGTAGVSIAMPLSPDALLLIVNEEHDGQVFAFAPDRDQRPSLMRDWAVSANIGSIASSSRLVFGRTHGALEASLLCLEPEERTARGGSMVSGVPRQWAPYVRDGVHVEYDDED